MKILSYQYPSTSDPILNQWVTLGLAAYSNPTPPSPSPPPTGSHLCSDGSRQASLVPIVVGPFPVGPTFSQLSSSSRPPGHKHTARLLLPRRQFPSHSPSHDQAIWTTWPGSPSLPLFTDTGLLPMVSGLCEGSRVNSSHVDGSGTWNMARELIEIWSGRQLRNSAKFPKNIRKISVKTQEVRPHTNSRTISPTVELDIMVPKMRVLAVRILELGYIFYHMEFMFLSPLGSNYGNIFVMLGPANGGHCLSAGMSLG